MYKAYSNLKNMWAHQWKFLCFEKKKTDKFLLVFFSGGEGMYNKYLYIEQWTMSFCSEFFVFENEIKITIFMHRLIKLNFQNYYLN